MRLSVMCLGQSAQCVCSSSISVSQMCLSVRSVLSARCAFQSGLSVHQLCLSVSVSVHQVCFSVSTVPACQVCLSVRFVCKSVCLSVWYVRKVCPEVRWVCQSVLAINQVGFSLSVRCLCLPDVSVSNMSVSQVSLCIYSIINVCIRGLPPPPTLLLTEEIN